MSKNNVEAIYPLSPLQEGLLFHALYNPQSEAYFDQLSCTLQGALDVVSFERAWQEVIDRHPVLRTAFVWERRDKPLQVVRQQVRLPLEQEDWRGLSPDEQQQRIDSWCRADRQRGFVLTRAPLMRLALLRLADDTHQLIWSSHHILLDGWSNPLVIKEVFASYEAFRRGQQFQVPRSRPYRDYIKWLQQQDMSRAETYWRETLKGFTAPIQLFGERPTNSSLSTSDASAYEHQRFQLSPDVTGQLQATARQHHLTLNTVVQGAWALLLSRYSGEPDVVFGVTVSGRPGTLMGVEEMVGLFINTLPLRVKVEEERELIGWLKEIHREQVEMREYEYSPLMEVQGWSEVRRGEALFETILVFENYPIDEALEEHEAELQINNVDFLEKTNYAITVSAAVARGKLSARIGYDSQLFEPTLIKRMTGHLRTLLEGMARQPQQRLAEIEMLSEAEQQQLLVEWNDTAADYPVHLCVHELFEAQVERTPDAVALVFEGRQLTYAELNTQANQLAQHLLDCGLTAEARVGVLLERSPETVIALLAIFKAGGVYLPLDPSYPHERIRFILNDAQAQVIITVRALTEMLLPAAAGEQPRLLLLNDEVLTPRNDVLANAGTAVRPDQLAYLIYTSGSTGTPKAVMVEHRNLVNTLLGSLDEFGWRDTDLMPCLASVAFDISLFEMLMPLISGGRAMMVGSEQLLEVDALIEGLSEVTVLHAVPSLMRQIVSRLKGAGGGSRGSAGLGEQVRQVYVGGDVVSAELVAQMREVFAGAQVRVLYGPTEATIICSSHEVGESARGRMIGRAMRNVRLSIRDARGRLVAVGVSGEVWIAGRGVTRGYAGRDELTSEKYVRDEAGERWYRSGDVGRWTQAGEIEYVGRVDEQVKVRGHRVELGEVEGALRGVEGVAEAVVVAREAGDGEQHLVAYVVKSEPSTGVSQLHHYLRERLPSYALPQAFVFMESLPLGATGKIDRRRLPEPGLARAELSDAYVKPETEIEQVIAAVWEETLQVEAVGRYDNLFELGANSLLMMTVNGKLKERFGQNILMVEMFKYPTVSSLARHLSREAPGADAYGKVQDRIGKQKAAIRHLKRQRAESER